MNRQRGQATPLMLGLCALVTLAVAALGALGWAHVSAARAQTAADLSALSAARLVRAQFAQAAAAGAGGRGRWTERIRTEAARVAAGSGGRLRRVDFGDQAWPPVVVAVEVAFPGPFGIEVEARARAGLAVGGGGGRPGGRIETASAGGYSGPLVLRDGKPTCPAVAAAFDEMDAAAHRDGLDLVVVSGYRGDAEQAILFARHPDPRWVARPGRSRHRDATELDLSMAGGPAWPWLSANAGRFGFAQRYSWEPWHYGYLPGCGRADGGPPRPVVPGGLVPAWVPGPLRGLVGTAAAREGVPPAVLAALLQTESGFDPRAVSPVGALGIAQFMPATARAVGLGDPFDPREAVPAAARHLGALLRRLGRLDLALAAYNAGEGAVRTHGGVPPFAETRAYVTRILFLAGGAGLDESGGVRLLAG